jgi:hypothetical protein
VRAGGVAVTLRLRFARSVGGEQIAPALAERLGPRLLAAAAGDSAAAAAGRAALDAFTAAFAGARLEAGATLDLRLRGDGTLTVILPAAAAAAPDAQKQPLPPAPPAPRVPIASQPLCAALLALYVGEGPEVVDAAMRDAFRAALAQCVSAA